MQNIIRVIWVIAVILVFISLMWYVLATTAFFKRRIDLDDVGNYIVIWTPALILNIVSILLLIKNKIPNENKIAQVILILLITILTALIIVILFSSVNIKERMKDKVTVDFLQITSDEEYEYRLEFMNLFISRSNYARLYIKEISTGEEFNIPVSIRIREIKAISITDNSHSLETRQAMVWSCLVPSDTATIYILTTTERLKREIEVFEIDISSMTAQRIE
jgi:hypothetical protein